MNHTCCTLCNQIMLAHWLRRIRWGGKAQTLTRLLALLFALLPLAMLPRSLSAQVPVTPVGRVAVVGSDDLNFPSVSLYVDVFDATGAPVPNLTPAAFSVTEDGQPATVQAVTADSSQPLALLLALDRSTDAATWVAVQAAAAGMISASGEGDQIAITAIADQVQQVQGFTAQRELALAALNSIVPGGEFSAINPALVDATNRFTPDLPVRRAIILVADAPDNISTLTTPDAITQLAGAGMPVYIVGFGPRVQNEVSFAQIAAATGGRAFAVASADQLPGVLSALLQEIGQGYRVDFVSALPADSQAHSAQVTVNTPTAAGTGTAQFTARPGAVEVALPNLSAGQPVAGVVDLLATVTAPGPVASVEYRVDDQVIGTAPDAQTPVAWDTSSLTPGLHTLSVTVVDSAGNQASTSVEVLIAESIPRLDLLGVDYDSFPQVRAYVDAFGANGLPLVGLSTPSFTVLEDNRPVDPATITTQVDASQPLHLVLVLDRGVSVGDWALLRNAGNAVVDALRPQDQVALYTFAGDVTLNQAVSAPNALRAALAAVQAVPPPPAPAPPGTIPTPDNALNQALLDATNYAATLPVGRRAVVVVTTGLDNSGQIALAQTVEVLRNQPVPVHVLGFDVDAQTAGTLTGIAQLAGGNAAIASNAGEIQGALQTLVRLLQQGYRLDFLSTLQADDQSHDLTITLAAEGVTAEATGSMIARSRPLTVTIPGVVEDATVGGAVDLTAQAETPAPITAVEYRLNGDILAEVADTTFSVIWNSDTVEPGPYTVDVTVVDAVGNQGSASVSFVVVPPITVAGVLGPRNTDGDIFIGDEVTLNATVEALSDDVEVEFFVNRVLVATDAQPPYTASFNSGEFTPGDHTVNIVARDNEGREATSAFPLALVALAVATPVPSPTAAGLLPVASLGSFNPSTVDWGRWLGYIGLSVLLLILLIVGIVAARNANGVAVAQRLTPMRLSLTNQGNVVTGYLLRADDPAGLLNFRFSLNGTMLGLPPVARMVREDGGVPSNGNSVPGRMGSAPGLPIGGQPVNNPGAPNGNPAAPGGGGIPGNIENIGDTLDQASSVGTIIGSIIYSVAYFLPTPLATPLRRVATQIRRGQTYVRRFQQVQRQVKQLNKTQMGASLVQGTTQAANQVGEVVTDPRFQQGVYQSGQNAGGAAVATGNTMLANARGTANRLYDLGSSTSRQLGQQATAALAANGVAVGQAGGARQWIFVPPINPGETAAIDVVVSTRGRNAGGGDHYPFRILSRTMAEESAAPVVEEGSIRIAGPATGRRFFWMALALIMALLAIVVLFVFFRMVF